VENRPQASVITPVNPNGARTPQSGHTAVRGPAVARGGVSCCRNSRRRPRPDGQALRSPERQLVCAEPAFSPAGHRTLPVSALKAGMSGNGCGGENAREGTETAHGYSPRLVVLPARVSAAARRTNTALTVLIAGVEWLPRVGTAVGVNVASPVPRSVLPVSPAPPDQAVLRIRLLGEIQVARCGQTVALPASKRTRALLGYLVASRTPQLRQTLCDLLWDGPDDPRGALRWSLSKLRDVIDDAEATRLNADRERVGFVAQRAFIDLERVRTLVIGSAQEVPLAALEEAAELLQGEFLDGLDLPSCHRFHHWCMAERERLGTLRRDVLNRLIERLQDDLPRALVYARSLVAADPLSEPAHATLIRLLTKAGRPDEAESHCQRASEMLRHEVGTAAAESLRATLREIRRKRSAALTVDPGMPPTQGIPPALKPQPERHSALVGRTAEMSRIANTVTTLFTGAPPAALMFIGPPGIGKSRLLEALTAEATGRGARAASARCYEAEMVRPYGCFIDALRGLPDELIPEELRPQLSSVRPGSFATADLGSRDRLLANIAALTQSLAETQPFVLTIDDLQWLDEASASLFHFLARSAIPRLLLAGAARAGEIEDNVWAKRLVQSLSRDAMLVQVAVEALDLRQTAALVGLDPASDDAVAAFRYSGGNPLLAVELARARQQGMDVRDQSLDNLIADQIARLIDPERELLVWAATIGREFRPELLGACLGLSEHMLFSRLERLERLGFLRPTADGYFDFTHDLVRQGVYRRQSQPHRRFLHRQIARALAALVDEEPRFYGDLVHHAGQAEDHGTAARACIAAGERCLRLCANAQAVETAERGLGHLTHLPQGQERIRLQIGLLGVKVFAGFNSPGDAERLVNDLENAADAAVMSGMHSEAAQALSVISSAHFQVNNTEQAHRATLRAERISRTADVATHFRQVANTAYCLLAVESSVPRALALIREAETLAETHNLDFVDLDIGRALAARWCGDLRAADNHAGRALTFAALREDRFRQVDGMIWLTMIALERGDYDEVEARCDEFDGKLAEIDPPRVPIMDALRALARLAKAEAGADVMFEAQLDGLRAVDDKARLAFILNTYAELSFRKGAVERAKAAAEEALAVANVLRRSTEAVVAHAILGRLDMAAGQMQQAVSHLEAARALHPVDVRSARALLHLEQAESEAGGSSRVPGQSDANAVTVWP